LNGKRPRGQPRQIWAERMKTDFTEISEETNIADCKSRDRWRGVVKPAEFFNESVKAGEEEE
jgi:hypothetical protein